MRKIILISLIVMGSLVFFLPVQAQESYYPYSLARISYVEGDVRVDRANDLGVEAAEVNYALTAGDKIVTQDGLVEINFGRNNLLRLDRYSIVEIASLPQSDEEDISLHLHQGKAYLRVSNLLREKSLAMHTPDASFYVLEAGLYRFEVGEQNQTKATVIEGSLEASGQEESLALETGESVSASEGYLEKSQAGGNFDDEFASWNSDRDQLLVRAGYHNSSYLPAEIREYEPELDSYGNWVYESPYGYVWVPTVTYVDWRPYLMGRWVWYPRIGWTWVSAEPWGWAVYHYGRWQWRLGLGWYWIPTVHWGPAWVHWYWDTNFVAWCPLSYWNRPLVIINNYVYERYSDIYYPIHSRALVMVRRNQMQVPYTGRTLIRPEELRGIEKIRLESRQPQIRPVVNTSLRLGVSSSTRTVINEYNLNKTGRISRLSDGRNFSSPNNNSQSPKILREAEKPRSSPSRSDENVQRTKIIRQYPSSSSTISREQYPQKQNLRPDSNEPRNNPRPARPEIKAYPERTAPKLYSPERKTFSPKKDEDSRIREYSPASRLRNDSGNSFTSHSSSTLSRKTFSIQERKSSSYNLPSLPRPYSQPSVRNRNEATRVHSYSPSKIRPEHLNSSKATTSHNSYSSFKKKNG